MWCRAGKLEQASACYRDSLTRAQEIGFYWAIIECLYGLGAVRAAHGRPEENARLFGAATKLCEVAAYSLPHAEKIEYDGVSAAVRKALGEKAYAQAIAEGRAMKLDQAVDYALQE